MDLSYKSLYACLLLVCSQMALGQPGGYTIQANILGQGNYKLSYSYATAGGRVEDTPRSANGDHIDFAGHVDEPVIAFFNTEDPSSRYSLVKGGIYMPGPRLEMVISNSNLRIEGRSDELYLARVKGDRFNEEFNLLKKQENPLIRQQWTLRKQLMLQGKSGDTTARNTLVAQIKTIGEKISGIRRQYIEDHPGSFISVYLLSQMTEDYRPDEYASVFAGLKDDWKSTFWGKYVEAKIKSKTAIVIGKPAIDFTKKDMNGNPFTLSSLRGKYVLLDFWGSWCGPCRASHPHLKALYAQYRDKGLEIVGVADEKTADLAKAEQSWLEAIKADGIGWLQVLNNYDRAGMDLGRVYGISGYPTKILLDKEGNILYMQVGDGSEALDAEMKKVFGE
jgi:thiol-disulfide isomerase/thioredoxin